MSNERTPGPWKATHIGEGEFRKEIIIDTATCGQIAEVLDAGNGAANAAFIVRACNSHDALLEALKAVMETFEREYQKLTDGRKGTTQNFTSMWMARAALQAAGIE